jgi:hypothetical protein
MLTRRSGSVLAFSFLLAACGGGQPAPTTPPPPAPAAETPAAMDAGAPAAEAAPLPDAGAVAAAAPDAGPAQKSWNDMSHDERLALMKTAVLPQMKKAFQDFDAKDFADFTCMTCHGAGIKQGKFDMPNPKLPKLDDKGFKKEQAKHPKAIDFMQHTVVPNMAKLLGLPEYDPATKSGFGCGNCHVTK